MRWFLFRAKSMGKLEGDAGPIKELVADLVCEVAVEHPRLVDVATVRQALELGGRVEE